MAKHKKNLQKPIEKLSERAKISRMIDAVVSEDYSTATKYLESVLEKKLEKRVNEELNKPIF